MYKLRTVTYGPDYEMYGVCPFCGSENYVNVNLEELEVYEYDDELASLLTFTLPVSENEVTLTLQTPRILDTINKKVNEAKRRRKTTENSTLLYTITTSIVQLNGEDPNPFSLEEIVRDLPMKDTNMLLNRINEINGYKVIKSIDDRKNFTKESDKEYTAEIVVDEAYMIVTYKVHMPFDNEGKLKGFKLEEIDRELNYVIHNALPEGTMNVDEIIRRRVHGY